ARSNAHASASTSSASASCERSSGATFTCEFYAGVCSRTMRAMLLCAGLSTRLGALGAARPKPMLPVCGMPILAYGIANLVGHGITELVINTHHRGDVIEQELGDGAQLGARIHYVHEPQILGTGGGLKHALSLLDPEGHDEPFLSANGKLIFDLDVAALVA